MNMNSQEQLYQQQQQQDVYLPPQIQTYPQQSYSVEDHDHERNSLSKAKSKPFFCCCNTVFSCVCCLIITVLLLAGLGVLLYFIFRIPDISNINMAARQNADGSGPVVISGTNPINVGLLMTLSADVKSNSIAEYKIDRVNVDVFIRLKDNGGLQSIGGGFQSLTLPAMGKTKLEVPATLNATGSPTNPVLSTILSSCGLGGGRNQIPLHYKVSITAFGIIRNFQVYESDYNLACPNFATTLVSTIGSIL
ncbi:hypothetical protein MIR68_001804 [Amoeboaphelidium protococcarum]|nr:hypothetical protein MIR68_001804 [Amoeboaphelidium protococcarum]